MIGDALETDVTGGVTAIIYSIWVVKDGIHNDGTFKKRDADLCRRDA